LLLVISPLPLRAGDLNTEVNDMFNNLGAIGNYTAPGPSAARPSIPTPAAT
jgi:conjugative transfer pilus assembly protein TraH